MCLDVNANLFTLVSQLDTFINGAADTKVHTQQGAIVTLSGLVEQLKNQPLVQKVIDITDLVTARAAVGTELVPFGSMVRVTDDPNPAFNGLYRANDAGTLDKQDYMEVNNLVQPSMLAKTFGSDEVLHNPVVVYSRPMPITAAHQWVTVLNLRSQIVGQKPGVEGLKLIDYDILVQVAPDNTINTQIVKRDGPSTVPTTFEMPDLSARVVGDGVTTRTFELYFQPFTDAVDYSPFFLRTKTELEQEELI